MGAVKRWLVLVSLAVALGNTGARAAELGLGLPPGSYVSSVDAFTLAINLQALTVSDSEYIRSSWLDELDVTAFDENERMIPMRVVARRRGESSVVTSQTPRNGVREDGVVLRAEIDVDGFPEGRATIRVEYQDLNNQITLDVIKGDEREKARFSRSSEAATQKRTYADYRAEAMRRLEEIPDDHETLWKLVGKALLFAPQDETEEYLRRAIEAQYAFIERMKKSEDPLTRALVQDVESNVMYREAMAVAIRSLLTEYYANRDEQLIQINWLIGEAALVDRESRELIKTVRATTPDKRAGNL
jgi:chaperonin cofactor prefoldin